MSIPLGWKPPPHCDWSWVHGKNANSFVGFAGLAAYCGSTLSRLFTALRLLLCRRTEFFLHHVDTLSHIRHGKCHVADIFAARGPARPHSRRGDGQGAPRAAAHLGGPGSGSGRPPRGSVTDRASPRPGAAGAYARRSRDSLHNLRRGHYELATDVDSRNRLAAAFAELALAI